MGLSFSEGGLICSVDVGTSAVRAALLDAHGAIIASARTERKSRVQVGLLDLDELWSDLVDAVRALAARSTNRVSALAVSAHVGTALADGDMRVLRAGGWGDSTGITELAEVWGDADALLALTGRPSITGGAAATIAWMQRWAPAEHRQIRHVLSLKDVLLWRITGVIATDATSAGYTLLSDVRDRDWALPIVSMFGIREDALPPQLDSTDVIGGVTAQASRELGLPKGLPVVCGGPDGSVGALAMIGVSTAAIADVSGTTDVVLSLEESVGPGGGRVVQNPYLERGLWSRGGPTGFTGGSVAFWARLLGLDDNGAPAAGTEASFASMAPGADGVMVNPHLNGSRLPDWDSFERGEVFGVSDAHTGLHIVRAAQEAAAYVVRAAVEAMSRGEAAHQGGLRDVVLGGGAARSAALVQLRADVLNRPVRAVIDPEVTLRGGAMLASVGSGLHVDLAAAHDVMSREAEATLPRSDVSREYDRLYEDWQVWREGRYRRRTVA